MEQEEQRVALYYGVDTRLDRVILADKTDIRYHYGQGLMPVVITANGVVVAKYRWKDSLCLLWQIGHIRPRRKALETGQIPF